MTATRWTHEEVSILIENYGNCAPEKLSELLPNRDREAIAHKACRLKIKRRGVYVKPYKPNRKIAKDWLLSNYVEKELSMQQCGDLLHLSPTTILKAIHCYGIIPRKETEKAHAKARELIARGDWPLLCRDNSGDNNNAKRPEVREKIRISKLGPNNAMYGIGKAHPLYGKRGPQSTNWRGGISFEPYCYKFTKELKEEIRDKFNRKCLICGAKEDGHKHHVHHVDYNKLQGCGGQRWVLVPLCLSCHAKTNYNRWYWFNLLIHYWAMNPDINFYYFNF